eukprot:COSAG01_NODE_67399_length_267_cov_0.619048_2_plen_51_part_01
MNSYRGGRWLSCAASQWLRGATQDETDDALDDEGLAGQVEAMIALIRTYEQ